MRTEAMMLDSAVWIACGSEVETPRIVKRFCLSKPVRASINVTGLGYFELYINGSAVNPLKYISY